MKTKLTNKQKILLLTKHDLNLISPPKKKHCILLQGYLPFVSVTIKTQYFMRTKKITWNISVSLGRKFHKNTLLGFVVLFACLFQHPNPPGFFFFFLKKKKKIPKRGGGRRTKINAMLKPDQG